MYVDWDPHLSPVVCFITPTYTPSMHELIMQGIQLISKKSLFRCKRTIGMSYLTIFYSLQNVWLSLLIGLNTYTKAEATILLLVRYRITSNISRTLVGNKIVDNSDVVGASPVGAAPTTSSFST